MIVSEFFFHRIKIYNFWIEWRVFDLWRPFNGFSDIKSCNCSWKNNLFLVHDSNFVTEIAKVRIGWASEATVSFDQLLVEELSTLQLWLYLKKKTEHNLLLYTHTALEKTKSKRLKIANVNFGSLVINIKQEPPVFWQTDKLQVHKVVNLEFCDQKSQETVYFSSGIHPFQARTTRNQMVSTSKTCEKYLWKSVYLQRFQNLACSIAKITIHCIYLFVEMNWLFPVW